MRSVTAFLGTGFCVDRNDSRQKFKEAKNWSLLGQKKGNFNHTVRHSSGFVELKAKTMNAFRDGRNPADIGLPVF